MGLLALGAGLGALLAHFFDRENGRRRRQQAIDRTKSVARKRAARAARAVTSQTYGVAKKVQHLREEPKEFDDATLADKVRSEAFRGEDVRTGEINLNVQDGIVQLRGEVARPDLINELVDRVRKVHGVRDVENLLHLPGTEAPMHE
jgi:osmotically-inducible protein OsmY